jgi:hypothetical protein
MQMKLLVLSDLHLEFEPICIPDTDADVIILAGGVFQGSCRLRLIYAALFSSPTASGFSGLR